MTTEQRTPSPWHVGVKQAEKIIYDERGWAVANCTVYHGEQERGEAKANAAFIVKACNAHDELAAALRTIAHDPFMSGEEAAIIASRALAKVTP